MRKTGSSGPPFLVSLSLIFVAPCFLLDLPACDGLPGSLFLCPLAFAIRLSHRHTQTYTDIHTLCLAPNVSAWSFPLSYPCPPTELICLVIILTFCSHFDAFSYLTYSFITRLPSHMLNVFSCPACAHTHTHTGVSPGIFTASGEMANQPARVSSSV